MLTDLIALALYPLSSIIALAHPYKAGEFADEFFKKRQTTTMKGIMILIVFFHHFSQICAPETLTEYAYRIGQPCITFFFFLSGYTTYLGHSKMEKIDLKKLWIGRAWRLYLPVMIFSILFNNFLGGLLAFFVFTDLAFIIFKKDIHRLAFITFGNFLYFVFLIVIGAPNYWFDDILTYFVGAAFAIYKNQAITFFESNVKYALCLIALIVLAIPSGYFGINYRYYDLAITVFSFVGCLIVVLLMMRLNIKSNIFHFIGNYTWEIFMFHQMFIILFNKVIYRNSIVLILSAVSTLGLSVAVHEGVIAIRKRVNENKK
ncbi:acyltransferase family protein [Butyrivibrio fibrisolvens]|uniref:acyltransferase family protein n=1 Tax=Pseudobutyrivibrio ruminis TaxID=46206 RepID=UPI00041E05B7|nr:acyltransferase family protein [Pseudobutyrivibrio ruminis]MDC7280499.1 acyltransferase family protein [Butyrivibrio fibrisolvens]